MTATDSLLSASARVSPSNAEQLRQVSKTLYPIEVYPPRNDDVPATLDDFVRGILEIQQKWCGLVNTSPTIAFEIRRAVPDRLRFQYVVPTKRLERKVRTQLADTITGVGFGTGTKALPVASGDPIGGGLLAPGTADWYSFATEFDDPPTNAITALLHRHAMPGTKIVVQLLFRPIAGNPLRNWWWRKNAASERNFLSREKEKLWGTSKPTRREKRKANAIDDKTGNARFWTAIRFAVIGAGQYTPSRVKELAGGFNRYENPATDQYFNAVTIRRARRAAFLDFYHAIAIREFAGWCRKFRTTVSELAALVSLPDRDQRNIQYATP